MNLNSKSMKTRRTDAEFEDRNVDRALKAGVSPYFDLKQDRRWPEIVRNEHNRRDGVGT